MVSTLPPYGTNYYYKSSKQDYPSCGVGLACCAHSAPQSAETDGGTAAGRPAGVMDGTGCPESGGSSPGGHVGMEREGNSIPGVIFFNFFTKRQLLYLKGALSQSQQDCWMFIPCIQCFTFQYTFTVCLTFVSKWFQA